MEAHKLRANRRRRPLRAASARAATAVCGTLPPCLRDRDRTSLPRVFWPFIPWSKSRLKFAPVKRIFIFPCCSVRTATRPTGEADVTAKLADNRYGKSRVRLVRLNRREPVHEFQEWAVDVLLRGDFLACFAEGDNSRILATDTMKNIVYSLGRKSFAECIEEFAKELGEFILSGNRQVTEADVGILQESWEHVTIGGKPHPTAFVKSGAERQTARVVQDRTGETRFESGIANLVIMKTADSAFEGFIRDAHTTLAETEDRLLGTSMRANWLYSTADVSFASAELQSASLCLPPSRCTRASPFSTRFTRWPNLP